MKGATVREGFRMAPLDLFSLQLYLQRGSGRGNVGKPALLAVPDGVSREIPKGIVGEAGPGAGPAATLQSRGDGDLGSRGFRRRGIGGGGTGGGNAATLPAASC